MLSALTWRDRHGVVHAVINDVWSVEEPPYALMMACHFERTWSHSRDGGRFGHIQSGEIRAANAHEILTCLDCIAYCGFS